MENLIILISSILLIIFGVYYFKNPSVLQKKELNRLKYFEFLNKSKYTTFIYKSMYKDATSSEFLKRAKIVSFIMIFMSLFLFFILILRLFKS